MKACKPFIKWVGGKTQLIKDIQDYLPLDILKAKNVTYIEPFVGGGAVLFWILQNYSNITHAVINDINPDLTNAYRVIQMQPNDLIDYLEMLEKKYYEIKNEDIRKEFYLAQREQYNFNTLSAIEKAGLFIFLNRTCFNGLYRVNKKGYFNVPFGRYAKPKICDRITILSDSELLQRVEILTGDFEQTLQYATERTLFYFDPPYKPISATSSFTTYAKEAFNDEEQMRLGKFCDTIHQLGHSFILSNSDVKFQNPKDDFFDELYSKFQIQRIQASRMINSKGERRGKISEILVTNTESPCFLL